MRTQILTLIDVTNTNARRNDDDQKEYAQQSNLNTIIQTASLRANLTPSKIEKKNGGVSTLNFGVNFKGKQKYWIITLEDDRQTPITEEMFKDDFDLVPYISDLTETFANGVHAFLTKNPKKCNIFFTLDDK